MLTPEEAATLLCPFARTFAAPQAKAHCQGPACALWRWEQITTKHPLWLPAVQKRAAETGETTPARPQASKWVSENLADLGIVPTRGFCGGGGQP